MTIVEALTVALIDLGEVRDGSPDPQVKREASLAITATEDAIMRTNRAFARQRGVFTVADVQAIVDTEAGH